MTIIVRNPPEAVAFKRATPFKLFVPREIEEGPARAAWNALRTIPDLVLADPFAVPGAATIFPGVIYDDRPTISRRDEDVEFNPLGTVADALFPAVDEYPSDFADAWLEVWVPESFEPQAEALAVDDLTQQ